MNQEDDRIPELEQLDRAQTPPADMEERVIAALRDRGLIRNNAKRRWLNAVAAVLLIAMGFSLGWMAKAPQHEESKYTHLLLLWQPRESQSSHRADLVQEYAGWARNIARSGVAITGEKLTSDTRRLQAESGTQPAEAGAFISGYFLLGAESEDDAVRRAMSCPHLRYGGTIELRKIDH